MLISVIIPTYKPKSYLFECLESLHKQTLDYSFYEVLVVLNGCDEPYYSKVISYISNFQKQFNISIKKLDQAGVSNARNYGMKKIKGNAICFIDDDDLVSETYLEELKNNYRSNTITVSNVKNFKNNFKKASIDYLGNAFENVNKDNFNLFMYRKFFSTSCCKLIPTRIIKDNEFSLKHNVGEDALFMATISVNVKSVNFSSSNAIYFRRIREGSASRKKKQLKIKVKERLSLSYDFFKLYLLNFPKYSFWFISSRIFATVLHIFKKN